MPNPLIQVLDQTLTDTPSSWRSKRAYTRILGAFIASDEATFGAMCAYLRLGPFLNVDLLEKTA